jgi:cell wall assembly regulator SMI1
VSQLSDRIDRLIAHWKGNSARSAGGVSESEVQQFEARHNVIFPADMREYFLKLNGMATNAFCDDDLYGFWQLQNVVTIAESFPTGHTCFLNLTNISYSQITSSHAQDSRFAFRPA